MEPNSSDDEAIPTAIDRRRLLQGAALTAGAFAVTPTVLTFLATPAAASGVWDPLLVYWDTNTAGTKNLTWSQTAPSPGGLCVLCMVAVDDSVSQTTTFSTPTGSGVTGWTSLGDVHSSYSTGPVGSTCSVWYGTYTAGAAVSVTAHYNGNNNKGVGFMAFAKSGRYVGNGGSTSVNSLTNTIGPTSSSTFPNDNGIVLWFGSWHSQQGSDTVLTAPSGYTNSASPTFQCLTGVDSVGMNSYYQNASPNSSVGAGTSTLNLKAGANPAGGTTGRVVLIY